MQNYTIIVVEPNENSRAIISAYLDEMGFSSNAFYFQTLSDGVNKLKEAGENSLIIFDIADINLSNREILEEIKFHTRKILITSADYSTDTIIKALRAGAKEFLPKPVIKEDLKRVIPALINWSDSDSTLSKIITVYSNKGGIGKTTIAVNLAAELARTTKNKVALVDLNLQLGDVSTFLNLNPVVDVNYIIKKLAEKEEQVLINSFEKYKDSSLYVLADPSYIEQAESITPQQISVLFKALKKVFPYIIVDMSSNIEPTSLKILDESDFIMFTTIVNIPAIRNSQRCLNLFNSRRYPKDKVKVVINRYMDNDEIKIEDIENTIGQKVYWKLPNNYFTIMEAVNKGVSISEVNPNSNICSSFRELAAKISDEIIEEAVIQYR